jgi:hypothetical protein
LDNKREQELEHAMCKKYILELQGRYRTLQDNQIAAANQSQYCDQQLDVPELMRKPLQVSVLPFEQNFSIHVHFHHLQHEN